jgi:hypothetical protein
MMLLDRIRKLLAYFVFLPNITPARVLFSSEIFPWAFLYSLRRAVVIPKAYRFFLAYLLLNALMLAGSGGLLVSARSLFALVNSSFIFIAIQSLEEEELAHLGKALFFVFGLNVVIGLVQYFGVFPDFLADFLRIFIERIQTEADLRGVSGLYSEPAYMSYAIHSFFLFYMFKKGIKLTSRNGIYALMALAIFDIFVIRSLTDIILLSLILLSIQRRENLIKIIPLVLVGFLLVYLYFDGHPSPPRSIAALQDFVENQHYKDPLPWILDVSGFRLASVWGSYRYGLLHPLGSGLGNWGKASIDAIDGIGVDLSGLSYFVSKFGIDYTGVRPACFGADLMLETGIVGFLLFVGVMWSFIFSKTLFADENTRPILVLFVFNCFLLGTIGDPIPFATFGMVCREKLLSFPSDYWPLKRNLI